MSQDRIVVLACSVCKTKNYYTERRKKGDKIKKLELKKFCSTCKKHTLHTEVKK